MVRLQTHLCPDQWTDAGGQGGNEGDEGDEGTFKAPQATP